MRTAIQSWNSFWCYSGKKKQKEENVINMWKIHIFSYKLKLSSQKKPDKKQKRHDRKRKSGLEHLRRFDHKNSGEITNTQRNKLRLRFALLHWFSCMTADESYCTNDQWKASEIQMIFSTFQSWRWKKLASWTKAY